MSGQVSDEPKKRKRTADGLGPKSSKKQKSSNGEGQQDDSKRSVDLVPLSDAMSSTSTTAAASQRIKKKSTSKKRRLIKRAQARGEEPPVFEDAVSDDEAVAPVEEDGEKDDGGDQSEARKSAPRFIAFIGNLPFTATVDKLKAHFKSIEPDAVRLPMQEDGQQTKPKNGKSAKSGPKAGQAKGFAFLEFSSYDRMKTCLKLYHHSLYDDGQSRARKINVELTAGGGGASDDRKAKIKEKNDKLQDQRRRRAAEEAKQGKRTKRKGKDSERVGPQNSSAEEPHDVADSGPTDGLHPARRAMLERYG